MVEIGCATITKIGFDVIKIAYKDDKIIDLADVKEVNDVFMKLSEGKPVYSLVDGTGRYSNFTKSAMQYLAKDAPMVQKELIKCSAAVIDNFSHRLVVKIFTKFHKPSFPVKIFPDQDEALKWIRMLRTTHESKMAG